jgi:hypothetical protein
MPSSVMLCRVVLLRTDVSEKSSASITRVTKISEVGIKLAVILMMQKLGSPETSVLTRATWRNIPEERMLHTYSCLELFGSVFRLDLLVPFQFKHSP